MKVARIQHSDADLAEPGSAAWAGVERESFALVPTPLNGNPAIKAISPFIEKSTDHGVVAKLQVAAAHNGNVLAIWLSWASDKHDRIVDLDEFVDGAAVMFPLTDRASAITMGSPADPVNAWYWKGNLEQSAFDVIATGYGTSARYRDRGHPISCTARHKDGRWHLVLSRALSGAKDRVVFAPGSDTAMAFAVWDGGNRERSGRKSFSGDFVRVSIEP